MQLSEYLKARNIRLSAFASMIGVKSKATVSRYVSGRIPHPQIMDAIVAVTGGAVTANDFYGIASPPSAPACPESDTRITVSPRFRPAPSRAPRMDPDRAAVAALDDLDLNIDPSYDDPA